MSQPATQIAIAVVQFQGRFLIGPRPEELELGGLWEFPGGKVEPGESPAAAAIRECREEAGLDVEVVGKISDRLHRYEHDRVHLIFFDCRPLDAHSSPQSPFRWIGRESLGGYQFPEGNREVVELLVGARSEEQGAGSGE